MALGEHATLPTSPRETFPLIPKILVTLCDLAKGPIPNTTLTEYQRILIHSERQDQKSAVLQYSFSMESEGTFTAYISCLHILFFFPN